MAIDKKAIVNKVFQGDALVGTTVTNPGSPWHYTPPKSKLIPYDPAAANRLLDKAGYKDTNHDGIRENPGGNDPLKLNFLTINSVSGKPSSRIPNSVNRKLTDSVPSMPGRVTFNDDASSAASK